MPFGGRAIAQDGLPQSEQQSSIKLVGVIAALPAGAPYMTLGDDFVFCMGAVTHTSVSPGSSGGALLDESGSVIGLTVAFVKNEGLPAGLNLFIPIGDAMDFLALDQQ